MNSDQANLDRLHDIVLPAAVSNWPLATGWYVLSGILVLMGMYLVYRFWIKWKADAYRRAALQELSNIKDISGIAELLRRTALAVVPRIEIAEKTGPAWADWLAGNCPDAMTPKVRQLLEVGVYSVSEQESGISALRDYVACWITHHNINSLHGREKSGE